MNRKIFLCMFTLGGSSGLILGNNIIDISLHDTYYMITHFHIILSLGTLFAILLGFMNISLEYFMIYMNYG